jgi:hypothetical protein
MKRLLVLPPAAVVACDTLAVSALRALPPAANDAGITQPQVSARISLL